MISIIIPTNKDPYIQKTLDSLLENSQAEIEILVALDNYVPDPPLRPDPRVKILKSQGEGMRAAINAGLARARGKFVMKCDCHCAFGPGYDKIMAENCLPSWLLIPRRYPVDEGNWQNRSRPVMDYHYLSFPVETPGYGKNFANVVWKERVRQRRSHEHDIDDTMTFQGSCWFANRNYFMKHVGFLDDNGNTYGSFVDEQQEVGLKYWLGGGSVKVIKKTWYAHLVKARHHYRTGVYSRKYKMGGYATRSRNWSASHWMNNEEPKMKHKLSWLVEKFWPVPGWPEDRKEWVYK